MLHKIHLKFVVLSFLAVASAALQAHPLNVQVEGAWVRATAAGQLGTGAYMSLTANHSAQLVGVSTPAAGIAEVHESRLEGDVTKMRAVPALDLPEGKAVQLKPGGYHLMLIDLPKPLAKGSTMPLTLHLKDAKGVESRQAILVPVMTAAPGAAAAPHSAHQHKP